MDILSHLTHCAPFKGISFDALKKIANITTVEHHEANEVLLHEGMESNDLLVIVKGSVDVYKSDEQKTYPIANLSSGQSVGELALFKQAERSATVKTLERTDILRMPIIALQKLIDAIPELNQLYRNFGIDIAGYLQAANHNILAHLKEKLMGGRVLLSIIVALCLFMISASLLTENLSVASSSYITIFLVLITSACAAWIVFHNKIPWQAVGFNWQPFGRSLLEGILFSLPIVVLAVLVQWLLSHYSGQHGLFHLYTNVSNGQHRVFHWWLSLLIYVLVVVPLQEIVVRGVLQSMAERFVGGRYKALWAILVSSIIFVTIHLYLSLLLSVLTFIPSLLLGWVFVRTRSLIAPITAHIIIGVWAFWIVGLPTGL